MPSRKKDRRRGPAKTKSDVHDDKNSVKKDHALTQARKTCNREGTTSVQSTREDPSRKKNRAHVQATIEKASTAAVYTVINITRF